MNSTPEFINTDANVLKQVLIVVVVRLLCLIAGLKSCSLRFQTADLRHHRAHDRCLENNRKLQLLVHFGHMYVRQKKPDKWTETCKPGFLESPILHQIITVIRLIPAIRVQTELKSRSRGE